MLHRVAGGNIVPPHRSGALTQPLQRILAADPADRPTMPELRDELATLAAGRDGDTTTILLARTDLGPAAPGRTHTTSFPAGAAAAAETPSPVASPPAPPVPPAPAAAPVEPSAAGPRTPTPPRPPRERGRRRGRALWATAALVALVLAGLIAVRALDPFADDGSNAQGSSADASSTPADPTTAQTKPSASQATATSAGSPASTAVDAGSVRAQDVDKAVTDFFTNVPGNLEAAYALTSPSFQSEFPLDRFSGFWSEFQDVKVSNIQTQDGSTTATVDIEYIWPDGRRQTERHVLTFVVGDDGTLLLERDAAAG
jgi:hypothetical protein